MRKVILFCLMLTIVGVNYAQKQLEKQLSGYVNPQEIVSLSANISFEKAIEALSEISEKMKGKRIVSTISINEPIGIEIDRMPYEKALLIIVQYKNLIFEETQNVIVIKSKDDPTKGMKEDVYASIDAKQVKISALFFEANITELRERGINWKVLFSGQDFSIGNEFKSFLSGDVEGKASSQTATETPPDNMTKASSSFKAGDYDGTAEGAFKFFETENLGEIIARPNVTVRDRQKGRIQIGSDISVKQRDFSGNVTDVFVSTGTIIEVVPYVYTQDNQDYILLKLSVERSTGYPDVVSTEIKKTIASTDVLMSSGDETIIGGLYVNEENFVRRGIPFLRDLPWWVLGIKYLTGYDSKQIVQKEVIILVKTEILPSLKEKKKVYGNIIENDIQENKDYINQYKIKSKQAAKED